MKKEQEHHDRVTIDFWMSAAGMKGEAFKKSIDAFNTSQDKYFINSIYKGDYNQLLLSLIAAFRVKTHPPLAEVFDAGTGTMVSGGERVYYPLYKLIEDLRQKKSWEDVHFLRPIKNYYANNEGHLLSYPISVSSPVLYFNKDLMRRAGLNPDKPPETWEQLADYVRVCQKKKLIRYGFAASWPIWVLIDNVAFVNNYPITSRKNGFLPGKPVSLLQNDFFLKHIRNLIEWSQQEIMTYGGHSNQSLPLFILQSVMFYMDSSSNVNVIGKSAKFDFGIAKIPYYRSEKSRGAPYNTLIGGTSLWALQGYRKEIYEGIERFMHFLSRINIQKDWIEMTGYTATTLEAYDYLEKSKFYKEKPLYGIIMESLLGKENDFKGVRLMGLPQIRDGINIDLGKIWERTSGESAEQQLKHIVHNVNNKLEKYY